VGNSASSPIAVGRRALTSGAARASAATATAGRCDDQAATSPRRVAEAAALFARDLLADAGPTHTVWLVWSPDYATFQGKCNGLLNDLGALRSGRILFYENPTLFYEHEELVVYPGS